MKRQLVYVADDQHMGAVEIGNAVVPLIVVRVRQNVRERRRVVAQTRESIRNVELETVSKAALRADLQPVVHRQAGVLGQAENAHPEIWPQSIGIHAGVRLDRCRAGVD